MWFCLDYSASKIPYGKRLLCFGRSKYSGIGKKEKKDQTVGTCNEARWEESRKHNALIMLKCV